MIDYLKTKIFGMKFTPKRLPEIDSVDIVNLKEINPDRVSQYMKLCDNAQYIKVEGELAQQFAELWRKLPGGSQARCHIPPFGLRFYFNNELQLQASICWQCDNIFGDAKGNDFWYAFDAQHQTSQKLLSLCKQVFNSL